MDNGRQSVTEGGVMRKHKLHADNWDLLKIVEVSHKTSIQTLIMTFIVMALSITADRVTNATKLFGSADPSQDITRKRWRWNCSGDEQELLDCPKVSRSESVCGHDRDAGVFCYGKINLWQLTIYHYKHL